MRRMHSAGLLIFVLLPGGCVSSATPEEEVLTLEVAPRTVECIGVAPRPCLLVRVLPAEEWTNFYDPIEGFTHEEGYRYRIEVMRHRVPEPPADGSSFRYRLLRIIEREPAADG